MYVVTVTFTLHENCADAFMPLMQAQAENSVRLEDGCHYFDVVHQADDPTRYSSMRFTPIVLHLISFKIIHFNDFDNKVKNMVKDKKVLCFDRHFRGNHFAIFSDGVKGLYLKHLS